MASPENYKHGLESDLKDEQMDRIIGNLLRLGLILSAVFVLFGAIFYLVRHGNDIISYHTFRGEPQSYRHIQGILEEALEFHGRGFILIGLVLLVATPVARVVFSVFAFLRQKDLIYVIVTSIVLGILLFSLIWGGGIR
jgi:uncharacterized membrane protein